MNFQKKRLAEVLRPAFVSQKDLPSSLQDLILDDFLLCEPVSEISPDGLTIAGVDGGLVTRSLAGIDLIATRAVGVSLDYSRNGVFRTRYWPSKMPLFELSLYEAPMASSEVDMMASLERTKKEVEVAVSLLEGKHPDMPRGHQKHVDLLLMDGAFPTSPALRGISVARFQKEISDSTLRLLQTAENEGTEIAWVIKDSRSAYFMNFLGKALPFLASDLPGILELDYRAIVNCRDADFIYHLLPVSSRSFVLKKGEEEEISVLSFYLKTVPYDSPLRIEISTSQSESPTRILRRIEKICGLVMPISKFHSGYSLPAPLVDADARAKIKLQQFETILSLLSRATSSPGVWKLKRERSPFPF